MTGSTHPAPLPPERIAEATTDVVRSIGRPARATLLRRNKGKEVHIVAGPGGSVVVKRGPSTMLPREAAIQHALAGRMPGSVPDVVAAVPAIDGFAMELLAADVWTVWSAMLAAGDGAAAAPAVGRAVANLHRIGAVDAGLRNAVSDHGAIARAYAENARKAAARDDAVVDGPMASLIDDLFGRQTTILHGDLTFANFLVGKDRTVLMDFERCFIGDAAYDMGRFVGVTIAYQIGSPQEFARAPLRSVIGQTFAAWQAAIDWEPAEEAGRRAVRIAVALALASACEIERGSTIGLPSLPAQRRMARRMFLDGLDAIDPLLDNLVPPDP